MPCGTPSLASRVIAGHPVLQVVHIPCAHHQQSHMKQTSIPGGKQQTLDGAADRGNTVEFF